MRTVLSRALSSIGRRNAQRDFLEEAEELLSGWQEVIDQLERKTKRCPESRHILLDKLESLRNIRRDAELELLRLRRLKREEAIDTWHREAEQFRTCDRRFTTVLTKLMQ